MAITRQDIIGAIHKGISDADLKYEQWTKGSTVLNAGVESIMVSTVAEELGKRQRSSSDFLDLECSFRDIIKYSGASRSPGRRRATLKGGNRADIVLFNSYGKPTCVIEIKRTWNAEQCLGDLSRIRDLIDTCSRSKGGSLRRGFLAMWIAKYVKCNSKSSAKDRIRKQISKINSVLEQRYVTTGLVAEPLLGRIRGPADEFMEEGYEWKGASFCIEISNKKDAPSH